MLIIKPTARCSLHTLHQAERKLAGTSTKRKKKTNSSVNNTTVLLEKDAFARLALRLTTEVFEAGPVSVRQDPRRRLRTAACKAGQNPSAQNRHNSSK